MLKWVWGLACFAVLGSSAVASARVDVGLSGGYLRVVDFEDVASPQGGTFALNVAWLGKLGMVYLGPDIQIGFDRAKDGFEVSSVPVMFGLRLAIPLLFLEPNFATHIGFAHINVDSRTYDYTKERFTFDATVGMNLLLGDHLAIGPAFTYRFNHLSDFANDDAKMNNIIAMLCASVRFGS